MQSVKMVYVFVLLFLAGNFLNCNVGNEAVEQKQLFDLNWKFLVGNHETLPEGDRKSMSWRNLDLPHDWSRDGRLTVPATGSHNGTVVKGSGWYKKQFGIPSEWSEKQITIVFDGLSPENEIYINGSPVDRIDEGHGSFRASLHPYLDANRKNEIAVRVIGYGQHNGTWNSGTGIYGHVWLVISDLKSTKK